MSTETEDGNVDRYVTQYIALNRLYNELWAQSHNKWPNPKDGGGDRSRATTHLAVALNCPELLEELVTHGDTSLAGLMEALSGRFYLRKRGDRHFQGYERLTPGNKVERILEALYQLRCNMFHGEKELGCSQEIVLKPANVCLELVLDAALSALNGIDI